jgi:hypothetical protein
VTSARHVASGAWGFTSSGCIFGDECIVIITQGNDWCSEIINAQMWPAEHPELAEPVKDAEGNWPRGCVCFNDAEGEILEAELPLLKYMAFSAQIANVARDDCDFHVPLGWDHNCYDESADGPVVADPGQGDQGECVGDCAYANIPKSGCGEDPSPYECEATYGEGAETGDMSGTDGTTSSVGPDVPREVQWTP